MNDIITLQIKTFYETLQCEFRQQTVNQEKCFLNVLLPFNDGVLNNFIQISRIDNAREFLSKTFNGQLYTITGKQSGLELLFECDFSSVTTYIFNNTFREYDLDKIKGDFE